jgi:hypothetical protein
MCCVDPLNSPRVTEKYFSKYFSKKALVQFLTTLALAERQEFPWLLRNAESGEKELVFSVSLCLRGPYVM